MANRRMFSLDVVDTDRFLDMASGAQLLYYNLGMHADDDGFVTSPRKIQRNCRATDGDFRELIREGYVKPFDSGVLLITHWRQNNFIRKDRYTPSVCTDEKKQVLLLESGIYGLISANPQLEAYATVDDGQPYGIPVVNQTVTEGSTKRLPDGTPPVNAGKDSKGKGSTGQDKAGKKREEKKPPRHRRGEFKHVLLSDDDFTKLKMKYPNAWESMIQGLDEYLEQHPKKSYANHLLTMEKWRRDDLKKKAEKEAARNASPQKQMMLHTEEENAVPWGWDDDEL